MTDRVLIGKKQGTATSGIWVSKPGSNVLGLTSGDVPEDDWYAHQQEWDWTGIGDSAWANNDPGFAHNPATADGGGIGATLSQDMNDSYDFSRWGLLTTFTEASSVAQGWARPKLKRTRNGTILATGSAGFHILSSPFFTNPPSASVWHQPPSSLAWYGPDYPHLEMRIRRLKTTQRIPASNSGHFRLRFLRTKVGGIFDDYISWDGCESDVTHIDGILRTGGTDWKDFFPDIEVATENSPWKTLEWQFRNEDGATIGPVVGGVRVPGPPTIAHRVVMFGIDFQRMDDTDPAESSKDPWVPEEQPMWEIDYVRVKKASIPANLGRWNSKQASLLLDSDVFSQGLVHQSGIVTIGTAKALINGNTSNRVVGHNIDNDANGYVSFPELDYIPLVLFQRIEEGVVGKSYPGGEDEFSVCTQNWQDIRTNTVDTTNPYHLTQGSAISTVGFRKAEDIFPNDNVMPWPVWSDSTRYKVTWKNRGLISKASRARMVLGGWNFGGGMNYPMYPNFYSYTSLGDNEAVGGESGYGPGDEFGSYPDFSGVGGDDPFGWSAEVGQFWVWSPDRTLADERFGGNGFDWNVDPERNQSTADASPGGPLHQLRNFTYQVYGASNWNYGSSPASSTDPPFGWDNRPWWARSVVYPNPKGPGVDANMQRNAPPPFNNILHDNPHLLAGSTPLHNGEPEYQPGSEEPVVRAEAYSLGPFLGYTGYLGRFNWEHERWKPRRYLSYLPTYWNPGPTLGGYLDGFSAYIADAEYGTVYGQEAMREYSNEDFSNAETFQEVRTFAYARAKKDGFWLTCRNAIGQEGMEPALNLAPVLPEEGTANQGSVAFTNMRSNNDNGAWGMFHPALTLYDTGDGNGPQKFTEGLQLKWDTRTTANLALLDKVGTDRYGRTYDQYKWWPSFSCSGLPFNGVLARPSGNTPLQKWDWPISYEPSLGNPGVVYTGESPTSFGARGQGGDEPILMGSTDSSAGSEPHPSLIFPMYDAEYTVNGILKGDTGGFFPHRYQANRYIHIDDKGVVMTLSPFPTGERRSKHTLYQYNFKRLASPGIFHPENVVPKETEAFDNRNVPSSGDTIENQTAYIGGAMNKKTGSVASYDKTKVNAPKYRYWVLRIPVSITEYTS